MARIGVLSDTHGLLRPETKRFLAGSDAIIHAGDIGRAEILEELSSIAPLTAVRGNNDRGAWAEALRETEILRIGAIAILVLHDIAQLGTRAAAAGARVVVTGHSHKPELRAEDGVLHLNPGSAGPRRFKLPVSLAEIMVSGDSVTARIVELTIATKR
ncbi:MAG: YfcE family phosphodiesterase [Rhodospirillales bacterium]|nr:YfcE family phosphodiesterase [Rhodospirillales bacterium]